jgi:hypothetical protein
MEQETATPDAALGDWLATIQSTLTTKIQAFLMGAGIDLARLTTALDSILSFCFLTGQLPGEHALPAALLATGLERIDDRLRPIVAIWGDLHSGNFLASASHAAEGAE